MNKNNEEQEERRKHIRSNKHFILKYYIKGDPSIKHDSSQLKNIGRGGLCLITAKSFEPSTILTIELQTPYLADVTFLEGKVLESHEKVKNIIYETRLEFENLSSQAEFVLKKLEEYFAKEMGEEHRNE